MNATFINRKEDILQKKKTSSASNILTEFKKRSLKMKKCLILGLFVWDAFIISDECEESLK